MGTGPGPGAELPARWVAGETGKVVARFSNPLRVPLELECVKAVLDGGARVQAFPTSVVLPPEAKFHEVRCFFVRSRYMPQNCFFLQKLSQHLNVLLRRVAWLGCEKGVMMEPRTAGLREQSNGSDRVEEADAYRIFEVRLFAKVLYPPPRPPPPSPKVKYFVEFFRTFCLGIFAPQHNILRLFDELGPCRLVFFAFPRDPPPPASSCFKII